MTLLQIAWLVLKRRDRLLLQYLNMLRKILLPADRFIARTTGSSQGPGFMSDHERLSSVWKTVITRCVGSLPVLPTHVFGRHPACQSAWTQWQSAIPGRSKHLLNRSRCGRCSEPRSARSVNVAPDHEPVFSKENWCCTWILRPNGCSDINVLLIVTAPEASMSAVVTSQNATEHR